MNTSYRNLFSKIRKAVDEAELEASAPKKFIIEGSKGSTLHTYEIEGDHFQVNDVGLIIYDAQGQRVAAFAPGCWKNCTPA